MRVVEALQRFAARVAAIVTRALLFLGLLLAYWMGVALTRAFAEVLARGPLGRDRRPRESWWQPARGYGTGAADMVDQS